MSAYIIVFVKIHDHVRFAHEYLPPVAATMAPFGGRVLAASDTTEPLEGRVPPRRTVLLEFPDLERAQRWYHSDAYAPLLALRLSITTSAAVLLPGGVTIQD
jgi:uncharacterized protein (DUF1330 family)